jgi:hypothetical protein
LAQAALHLPLQEALAHQLTDGPLHLLMRTIRLLAP